MNLHLHAFHAANSDSDVGFLNHSDVVCAVSYCQGSLASELLHQSSYLKIPT